MPNTFVQVQSEELYWWSPSQVLATNRSTFKFPFYYIDLVYVQCVSLCVYYSNPQGYLYEFTAALQAYGGDQG